MLQQSFQLAAELLADRPLSYQSLRTHGSAVKIHLQGLPLLQIPAPHHPSAFRAGRADTATTKEQIFGFPVKGLAGKLVQCGRLSANAMDQHFHSKKSVSSRSRWLQCLNDFRLLLLQLHTSSYRYSFKVLWLGRQRS